MGGWKAEPTRFRFVVDMLLLFFIFKGILKRSFRMYETDMMFMQEMVSE